MTALVYILIVGNTVGGLILYGTMAWAAIKKRKAK